MLTLLLFAACGSVSSHTSVAHAGSTPNVSATQTVQAELHGPVTVQVSILKQQGSLASQTVILTFQVTVTNHTTKPIWLYGTCQQPDIILNLTPQEVGGQTRNLIPSTSCELPGTEDLSYNEGPGIAPHGSQVSLWHYLNLFDFYGTLQPGTYTLAALVSIWHQGALEQLNTPDSGLLAGSALGQTTITLS